MKRFFKYILAFIIPVICVAIIFKINGIAPFGIHPIRIYDSYYQYTGLFLNIKNFSFYSLKAGLGFNFLATSAYYLLNPFNILFLFSDVNNIDIFYTIIVLLKIGLASLTMTILLNYKNDNNTSFIFGIFYGLSGFIITYYYNIMWIDGIIFLPLVILGLKRLVFEHKPLTYLVFLSIALITNFYIAYMVCIFTTLFFIFLLINEVKENRKKVIINFIIYSLLSGLISSFILLPAFFGLLIGKASGYARHDFTQYFGMSDSIKYFFYKLSPGTFISGDQDNFGPMLIYSTLYALVLLLLSIFNPKFSFKYKTSLIIFFLIFFLSFGFNLFDYAWQFFQRPVWWNSRYAFTFSFFIIYFAYQNYLVKKHIKPNKYYVITSIVTILLFISSFTLRIMDLNATIDIVTTVVLGIVSVVILISYFIFINKPKFSYYIITLIVIELVLNTMISIKGSTSIKNLETIKISNTSIKKAVDMVDDRNSYRMEFVTHQTSNDGLVYDYNGINYFNSVRNQNYVNFAEYVLGFTVNSHCSTKINYFDPLVLNLLNVKYLIGNVNYYPTVNTVDGKSIHDTTYDSSFGYLVSSKTKKLELNYKDSKETKITNLINTMIDEDYEYYTELSYQDVVTDMDNATIINNKLYALDNKKRSTIKIKFTNTKHKLLVVDSNYQGSVELKVNNKIASTINYYELRNNDSVEITINNSIRNALSNLHLYLMDVNNTNKAITKFVNNRLELTDGDSIINGNIIANSDSVLFLSLPYEKGFIIKVDGKKVPYYKLVDTFVAIDIKEGKHHISVDYVSHGFNVGLLMSFAGIGISSILLIKNKWYNKKEG